MAKKKTINSAAKKSLSGGAKSSGKQSAASGKKVSGQIKGLLGGKTTQPSAKTNLPRGILNKLKGITGGLEKKLSQITGNQKSQSKVKSKVVLKGGKGIKKLLPSVDSGINKAAGGIKSGLISNLKSKVSSIASTPRGTSAAIKGGKLGNWAALAIDQSGRYYCIWGANNQTAATTAANNGIASPEGTVTIIADGGVGADTYGAAVIYNGATAFYSGIASGLPNPKEAIREAKLNAALPADAQTSGQPVVISWPAV